MINKNKKKERCVVIMKKKFYKPFWFLLLLCILFLLPSTESCAAKNKAKKLPKPDVTISYHSPYVSLTWKKVKGAEEYVVYRQQNDKSYKKVGTTKALAFIDKDIISSKRYSYKVFAVDITNAIRTRGNKTVCSIYTAKIDPTKKMIALTFDDGPGKYTVKIAKCLKKYDSRATYFVVGNRIKDYKNGLKYAYDNGCEIGNHSYTHANFLALGSSGIKKEIKKTDKMIEKITGEPVNVLRTPGGARSKTISRVAGKPMFYWSIDTRDWENRNTNKIINNVMRRVKDGDIILLHEIYGFSSDAIIKLIPKLKKAGYQLVTVSELAKYKGYQLQPGKVYYSFP